LRARESPEEILPEEGEERGKKKRSCLKLAKMEGCGGG